MMRNDGVMGVGANETDSHQHHFEDAPVFAGCGVMEVGANETDIPEHKTIGAVLGLRE